jgi:hypothetical protein
MSSQARASRDARSAPREGDKEKRIGVELDVGRVKGTSYFVSAIYVPGDQGYVEVSTEPVKKEWHISSSRVLATARYELPEGSVIVYKVAKPSGVETRAYLVTREGLREIEATTIREVVDNVGGRDVYRFVDVIKAPLGEIRVPSERLYVAGFGAVTPEQLEVLRERAKHVLAKSFYLYPLSYEPTRRLSDEEFKQVLDAGLRYENGRFILPVTDPDLDIDKAIAFLKANVHGFTEEDAERVLEEWREAEPVREFKKILGEIVGAKVKDVYAHDLALRHGEIRFKPVRLGEEEFKKLRERFKYVGEGWFSINICAHRELLEAVAKYMGKGSPEQEKAWLEMLGGVCAERAKAESEAERVKKTIRERHGVEPVSVEVEGDYYVVKFPYLGAEKFRELAKLYKYSHGKFYIEKNKI